ncbi:hypothetical protein ABH940_007377, partial [Streptacidiphilus sp. BW17]
TANQPDPKAPWQNSVHQTTHEATNNLKTRSLG